MSKTSIEWTDMTWNPTRGCSRVSEGCRNCYAERIAARNLPEMRSPTSGEAFAILTDSGPRWTGKVELIESKLLEPLKWRKPRRVFVNSMSDLFHENLPDEAIDRVFAVMALTPHITYQVLTKRAERMWKWADGEFMLDRLDACIAAMGIERRREFNYSLPNVHLGVSVEDQPTADQRIPELLKIPAAVRFVSYEPALAGVDFFPFSRLDQIIIGGESGPGARPFDLQWARDTIRQSKAAGVAVFVKQLGSKPVDGSTRTKIQPPETYRAPISLKDRKGGDMSEWPEDLRIREFPR